MRSRAGVPAQFQRASRGRAGARIHHEQPAGDPVDGRRDHVYGLSDCRSLFTSTRGSPRVRRCVRRAGPMNRVGRAARVSAPGWDAPSATASETLDSAADVLLRPRRRVEHRRAARRDDGRNPARHRVDRGGCHRLAGDDGGGRAHGRRLRRRHRPAQPPDHRHRHGDPYRAGGEHDVRRPDERADPQPDQRADLGGHRRSRGRPSAGTSTAA